MKTQERDPFGLATLPELQAPQDGWLAVSAQLQQQQRRRQQWLSGLAIAATVTLVAGIVSILPQQGALTIPVEQTADIPTASREQGSLPHVGGSLAADNPGISPAQESDNLAALQKLSQRLEQNLRYLSSGAGAMPAEMVVYQVELEDLVAQVDDAISQDPESSELWQQRVSLLMDLNQIYGAGLRRDEPYVASL
ncbi:MAG TPA: hypothetical protein VJN01_09020 [Xanthomonadales bacterium]|nr:hypothetical protein [Xanthomonadales bacterium]